VAFPVIDVRSATLRVGQFLARAKKFEAQMANVVLVYPGPADGLKQHASEFIRGKTLPANFYLALDPDFAFTLAYGLRWEAKSETAYPATFVIDSSGKVSMSHGGRATADKVLKALSGK
jgi:thioredoxin-dependent peroxiredoxin